MSAIGLSHAKTTMTLLKRFRKRILMIFFLLLAISLTRVETVVQYGIDNIGAITIMKHFGVNWKQFEQNWTEPAPLLEENAHCPDVTDLKTVELGSRRFSANNLRNVGSTACIRESILNVFTLLHMLGMRQENKWVVEESSLTALLDGVTLETWKNDDRTRSGWVFRLLSRSLARIGASQIITRPGLAHAYLTISKSLDATSDPMLSALLVHTAGDSQIGGGRDVEFEAWLMELIHFPDYRGQRLTEYLSFALPIAFERNMVSEHDLANWVEYLIDLGEIKLAKELIRISPGQLHRSAPVLFQMARLSLSDGDAYVARANLLSALSLDPNFLPARAMLDTQLQSTQSSATVGASICRELECSSLVGAVDNNESNILANTQWTWHTWSATNGYKQYAPAGFVGQIGGDGFRIQGLWWNRTNHLVAPRAGYLSDPITLLPHKSYSLSFQYRTSGVEGVPDLYISDSSSISPYGDVFLPKTHGEWVNATFMIDNASPDSYVTRIILRSLFSGTTWYRDVAITPVAE